MKRTSPSLVLAAWLMLFLVLAALPATAQGLKVDITRGQLQPMPVAVVEFQGLSPDAATRGKEIADVVSADLERSGLFRPLDRRAFLDPAGPITVWPNFNNWRVVNAQALVVGATEFQADGQLRVEFRLWDVYAGLLLTGFTLSSAPANWRRVAHLVADEIYKRLTGEDGYFDTRIVYISESGPAQRRVKRLAIMDQDGESHKFLTDGGALVLTPRFSPSAQEITYLSYFNNKPRVYLFNVSTGAQEVLGDFPGMTFAPRFSPDGNKVVMSMASEGNSEIYTMDLRTREVRRLTNHPAIDTAPCYSPDGTRIVFESDRGGSQQLYLMGADGGEAKRISFGEGHYGTPVWSPRGDLIAFTRIYQGRFAVGVMRTDGSGARILAEDYLIEAPTWSPNGRVLMFFRQQPSTAGGAARSRLYSIDLTGYNEREIMTPLDASDPAWSPLGAKKG
ncbi:MAG: Tol-Pal system protein TolB [Alphaproteobacteria bacterium]|nr:Tol-Pal system protein TolB [Alphaproteobacteria bacterium]